MPSNKTNNYYDYSKWWLCALWSLPALASAACGGHHQGKAGSARRVSLAQLAALPEVERHGPLAGEARPVILEVKRGERFAADVLLESRLLRLEGDPSWSLQAKEDLYVLLTENAPPRLSKDGVHFEPLPSHAFNLGVEPANEGSPKLHVVLQLDPSAN